MKSFFKKLSFVLAAAMVVTMVPANSVKAADEEKTAFLVDQKTAYSVAEPETRIAISLDDNTKDFKFVGISDYKEIGVQWTSSNEAVATVDKSGKVTPVAVGETTISLVAPGYTVTPCKVVVVDTTKSADLKIVDQSGAEAKVALTVDDEVDYTFSGCTDWKNAKTKTAYFESSDSNVLKCTDSVLGTFTAVAEGKATVSVAIVTDGKTCHTGKIEVTVAKPAAETTATPTPTATATPTPEAPVVKEAVQTTDKRFTVDFGADFGSLTEVRNSVKFYYIQPETGDVVYYPISVVKNDDTVVTFESYIFLQDGVTYGVEYKGEKYELVAFIGEIVKLGVSAPVAIYNKDNGYAETTISVVCLNSKGIDITASKKTSTSEYEFVYDETIEYAYLSDENVTFYEANKGVLVKVKLVDFDEDGNEVVVAAGETVVESKEKDPYKIFYSAENSAVAVESYIKSKGTANNSALWNAGRTIRLHDDNADNEYFVVARFKDNEGVNSYTNTWDGNAYGSFIFKSADENKLFVDEADGQIYTFEKGTVNVLIFFNPNDEENSDKDTYLVGTVAVVIKDERTATNYAVDATSKTVSTLAEIDVVRGVEKNATAFDKVASGENKAEFKITVTDQDGNKIDSEALNNKLGSIESDTKVADNAGYVAPVATLSYVKTGEYKLTVYGSAENVNLAKGNTSATFKYSVPGLKSTMSVTVKSPVKNETTTISPKLVAYLTTNVGGTDVYYNNSADNMTLSASFYWLSNGLKYQQVEVTHFASKTDSASLKDYAKTLQSGTYFATLSKGTTVYTDGVDEVGLNNAITITTVDANYIRKAAQNTGVGSYALQLYVATGDDNTTATSYKKVNASATVSIKDTSATNGAVKYDVRTNEKFQGEISEINSESIKDLVLACFDFKYCGKKINSTSYIKSVDYIIGSGNVVYIKSVTFDMPYSSTSNGLTAALPEGPNYRSTVNVNKTITISTITTY